MGITHLVTQSLCIISACGMKEDDAPWAAASVIFFERWHSRALQIPWLRASFNSKVRMSIHCSGGVFQSSLLVHQLYRMV